MGLNGLFGIIQKLSWILDSKPDLAIGSQGLYFPKRIKYRELYWKDISSIEIIRTRGKRGRISSPTMKFLGIAPTVRTLRSVGPLTAPLFCTIPPIYGFDYEAVLASIRELAPNVVIHEVEEAV